MSKLTGILSQQQEGPIVYLTESRAPSIWTKFSQLQEQDRLKHLKKLIQEEPNQEEEQPTEWSWRKLFDSFFGSEDKNIKDKAPDCYNIYKRSPDFKNNYGWSIALDGSDDNPLKYSGIGIYLVSLTAVINFKTSQPYALQLANSSLIGLSHATNNFELDLYLFLAA